MNISNADDALLFNALADNSQSVADPVFATRVLALASYDLATRRRRRKRLHQVGRETTGFTAAIALFVVLARSGLMDAGAGDTLALASPAMLGVLVITSWLVAVVGPSLREPVATR